MINNMFVLVIFSLLAYHTPVASGHPQCLDYLPPFQSAKPLGLCKETSQYGCCTSSRDKSLQNFYDYARNYGRETGAPKECEEFLRTIICAECSPYAAHIFDAETPPAVKTNYSKKDERFPGLCYSFCFKSFEVCRNMVLRLPLKQSFRKFIETSNSNDFCQWAVPTDKDYCVPQVNDFVISRSAKQPQKDTRTMCVQPVLNMLFNPLVAVPANDGTNRLFIGEQRGMVHVIDVKGNLQSKKPFLDLKRKVLNSGQAWDERGFLGMVFHPKFASNGRFFVYYSCQDDKNVGQKTNQTEDEDRHWFDSPKHKIRISEFIVSSSDPNVADSESEVVILELDEPEPNHEGGMIFFGDDGYLYIVTGDGGGGGDRHWSIGNSLNMTNLLGKVLRVDVDVYDGRRYRIPSDNPFIGTKGARPEIYAYGARNMWRCSKDRGDPISRKGKGRVFCGDVGQNQFEEIDIIAKGGNYGWRAMEGNECYDKTLCTYKLMKNYKPPIIVYNHTIGKSIVGGYVYRGCQNPALQGRYIYADTVSGRMFAAEEDLKTGKWISEEIVIGNQSMCNNALQDQHAPHILSFGEDETGELYFASVYWPSASQAFGALYKLVDPVRRSDPEVCSSFSSKPKVLKNVKKRKIDDSQSVTGEYKKPKLECNDTRYFCRFMNSMSCLCKRHQILGQLYCKKACGYCKRVF